MSVVVVASFLLRLRRHGIMIGHYRPSTAIPSGGGSGGSSSIIHTLQPPQSQRQPQHHPTPSSYFQSFSLLSRRSMSMFLWRHVPIYQKSSDDDDDDDDNTNTTDNNNTNDTDHTDNNGNNNNNNKTTKNTRQKRPQQGVGRGGWRLNKYQTKPAHPVRVEGLRGHGGRVYFRQAVITPDGAVHPFRGKYGQEFIDFWNAWRERYKQIWDYQMARGIPHTRYCPRCDEPMHWLRRGPAKFVYTEVNNAKRRLYDKIDMEVVRKQQEKQLLGIVKDNDDDDDDDDVDDDEDDDDDDEDDDDDDVNEAPSSLSSLVSSGPMEDRYCCPNDECGIREARVEYKRNCAIIKVLDGLTDKQWNPTRFKAGRKGKLKSQKAKAKLAEIPFLNRGWPTDPHMETDKPAPYMNSVSHEEAMAIVEKKAKKRYEKSLVGENPKFGKRPSWYTAPHNFRYSNRAKKTLEKECTGSTPCDECGDKTDRKPSVCFYCGCVLCKKCRKIHFPMTRDGIYKPHGQCPACSKKATKSLDMMNRKNHKQLERLLQAKSNDPRKAQWLLCLGNAYALKMMMQRTTTTTTMMMHSQRLHHGGGGRNTTTDADHNKERAIKYFLQAGELGLLEGYSRLGDFYLSEDIPPNKDQALHYYKMAAEMLLNQSMPQTNDKDDDNNNCRHSDLSEKG